MMAGPGFTDFGMSGRGFDAFVNSQQTFNDNVWAAKLQEKYWLARQKFLEKVEKKEDECIVLSDAKLDAKLGIYKTIDKSCARLVNILENYQNGLYLFANEENALGILLKECAKCDKTKAGEIMSIVGKSLAQSSHQRIKLYLPLLRMYQELETFHSRAVEDTSETVSKLENKRSKYRASLLWMKNVSENLDPDVYRQLDKFRRVQNQVRSEKKAFDATQMDVVQKIDLLMASRCNLLNQILSSYQTILLETFEKNLQNFESVEEIIKKQDIYEYEFKQLKELNPLKLSDNNETTPDKVEEQKGTDLLLDVSKESAEATDTNNNDDGAATAAGELIEVAEVAEEVPRERKPESDGQDDMMRQLEDLFGSSTNRSEEAKLDKSSQNGVPDNKSSSFSRSDLNFRLLQEGGEQQLDDLLGPSESNTICDIGGSSSSVQPEGANQTKTIDLLTNELDDIDNSSYFKSLQRLQL